ncbi:hydrogenase expression/formation protein HypE [Nitrospirillum viridazoti Y2]|uniref:Hydrogenase expression/formation protein HypE n=1 Tax=Nitrospirillum amazonense TaxID=28077 RepID=A0A560IQ95_9PROT|nr:hydrogenase expression/formation protein HypE [Nitrospirillum amazonense]EGX99453.1 hydrogenase expression/formation protein HypE [Nitrospirillum amazonense Y2]TWB60631.1 hydrogenase expression/formation protein HypE [Nitrospirillum amazonense]
MTTPPPDLSGAVDMSHGGGGRAMARLTRDIFLRHLANPLLDQGHDATRIDAGSGRIAVTTDAHVISPLFFPGGDIGSLAVHGTLNDLAMAGARPVALTAAFIIEEGFPLADLDRIAASMGQACRAAGVPVATGDTKVVERGKGDGVFITTSGIGVVPAGVDIGPRRLRPGQAILLSGPIGDHGIAILSKRQGLEFGTEIRSDSAALHRMVADMVATVPGIAVLRDPTRGGLSATLNELTNAAGIGMLLDEPAIPVRPEVAAACELLGLDPLNVANEGKLICVCEPEDAETLLAVMRNHAEGRDAALIGHVTVGQPGFVRMTTAIGGQRVVDWLSGEQLPRIC